MIDIDLSIFPIRPMGYGLHSMLDIQRRIPGDIEKRIEDRLRPDIASLTSAKRLHPPKVEKAIENGGLRTRKNPKYRVDEIDAKTANIV